MSANETLMRVCDAAPFDLDGVRDFLASRGIDLPFGDPSVLDSGADLVVTDLAEFLP